jgi:Transcriptional regulators
MKEREKANIQHNVEKADVLNLIKRNCSRLSSSQTKVASYIMAYPEKVLDYTALQIAKEADVSEATVVRFCREIGYKGYPEFKIKLAKDYNVLREPPMTLDVNKHDDYETVLEKIVNGNIEDFKYLLSMMNMDAFNKAVKQLQNAKRIGFFAVGGTYPVAYDAYWHFSNIGKMAQTEIDPSAQMVLAQSLTPQDLAFAISIKGQSQIPVMCMEIAKKKGVPTVCLTQNMKSKLVEVADCAIVTHRRVEQSHDLISRSKIVMFLVVNALCMATTIANWDESMCRLKENLSLVSINQF